MLRLLSVLLILAACSGPQKSLTPVAGGGEFRSAFVPVVEAPDLRAIAHVVALDGDVPFGLVTHVSLTNDRLARVERVRIGDDAVAYQRLSPVMSQGAAQSGMIALTMAQMEQAADTGLAFDLCDADTCRAATVPATLFQQALFE